MKPGLTGAPQPPYLILGLGNVGERYHSSRHNIGFDVVDELADRLKIRFTPAKGDYFVADTHAVIRQDTWWRRIFNLGGETISPAPAGAAPPGSGNRTLLFKPTTLMNRSGIAARGILQQYGYSPERMLVIADDFHLQLGALRLRERGSDGGHNGLASIIRALDVDSFPRLRLGIGPKPPASEIVSFVLSRFDGSEMPVRERAVSQAADACLHLLGTDSQNALALTMSKYNIVAPDPAPGSGAGDAS
ncbi:MAG: aminoacyl-tRNA hydrolase [Candidatus Zixiibacteriota bacterium]